MAERIPIRPAVKAMPSGVRDKGRAAAAGMINMAAISNTPTTLTPLLDVDGAIQLEFRDNAVFKAHDHDDHATTPIMTTTPIMMATTFTARMILMLGCHQKMR